MKLPFAHNWVFDGVWYECSRCGDTTFGPKSTTTYFDSVKNQNTGIERDKAEITISKPPRWHNGGSQGNTYFCRGYRYE